MQKRLSENKRSVRGPGSSENVKELFLRYFFPNTSFHWANVYFISQFLRTGGGYGVIENGKRGYLQIKED